MSSLSSTWEAYHAAQKDLVSSISHRLTSARPIYAVPSHQRQAYSQTVQSTVHELREAQSLLRAASARLQSLELEIFPFLADAESALAPISAVPLEVLRSIILFAVGDPSDTRSVLRVSQVSRAWRNLTLDASELFTHADWNHWHIELIQKWNTRAKHRQLAVTLMPNRFDALFPTAASRPSSPSALRELELEDFRDELFVSLSKCSSLSLTFDCPFNKVLACLGHLAAIIHGCSVLRDLSITSLGFSIIRFKLERPISIERLYLRDIDIIAAPNLQPQHIVYDFAAWSMPLDTLTVLPHLTSLTVFRLMPQRLEGTPDIHLDALKTLEVRPYWNNGARSLPWLLRILKMPNVEHFIMNGVALSASEEKSIWPVVANAMPQIRSLTLKRDRIGYWPLDIRLEGLRESDQEGILLLPAIAELRLLGRDVAHLLPSMQLFISARRGSITHLTLPPREEFDGDEVGHWEALRELVPHVAVEGVPHFLPLHSSVSQSFPAPLPPRSPRSPLFGGLYDGEDDEYEFGNIYEDEDEELDEGDEDEDDNHSGTGWD